MELGKIYIDRYNNRVKVISDDFTGLNRNIVYGQFIDRVKTPITKKRYVDDMQNNIIPPHSY
jgi:hypothetical protein